MSKQNICYLEVFTFGKYFTDLTTNSIRNRIEYPSGTNYDFDIADFDTFLCDNGIYITDRDELESIRTTLIKNKTVSIITEELVNGETIKTQHIIIIKVDL